MVPPMVGSTGRFCPWWKMYLYLSTRRSCNAWEEALWSLCGKNKNNSGLDQWLNDALWDHWAHMHYHTEPNNHGHRRWSHYYQITAVIIMFSTSAMHELLEACCWWQSNSNIQCQLDCLLQGSKQLAPPSFAWPPGVHRPRVLGREREYDFERESIALQLI